MPSLSSQKIKIPGVFKTLYSICLSPTSKTNMHQRSRFQSQLWHFVEKLIDRVYEKVEIHDSILKAFDRNREDLLTQNNKPKYRIQSILTYNRTLPNVKEAVRKHLNILKINNEFKNVFLEPPIMCFRINKYLNDFLWTKTIVNNKAHKVILSNRKGYSIPCHSKTGNLCCKQVKHTNTFSSTVTKRTSNIYNKLNCKSCYLIYLMECTLCKWQYTGKSETAFNIRLNNHCEDLHKTNTPEAYQYFRLPSHNFNRLVKCTVQISTHNTVQ